MSCGIGDKNNLRIEAVSELDASKRSYKMSITYKNNKDSPCDQLSALFTAVGWSDETKPEPFFFSPLYYLTKGREGMHFRQGGVHFLFIPKTNNKPQDLLIKI